MKLLILTLHLICLSGCAGYNEWRMEKDLKKMRADALKKIDVAACEKSGGKIEGVGMFGIPSCVVYYADGGKPCKSESECEGMCFSPDVLEEKTSVTGICERSEQDRFGCYSAVENGVVLYSICAD